MPPADPNPTTELHAEPVPDTCPPADTNPPADDPLLSLLAAWDAADPAAKPTPEALAPGRPAVQAALAARIEQVRKVQRGMAPAADDPLGFLRGVLTPDDQPGTAGRFGDYRVFGPLGAGGMGVVLAAEDVALRRPVAVKLMRPEVAARPQARERFLREARAAAAIDHPHVVAIHRVGEWAGLPYLVMPRLAGRSLADRLKDGPVPLAEAVDVARQMADGLAAAHAAGLVHRDVKPANVWVEPTGRVRVLDFGLARPVAAADGDWQTPDPGLVGTPAYMAPEQARGGAVDHRADLFSLGVVLYRLAAGRLPFRGDDVYSVLSSLALDVPPPLAMAAPAAPPPLDALVNRLLCKDPAGRPPSAAAVAAELAAIARGLTTPSRGTTLFPVVVLADPPRRRWRWAAAGLAAVVLLVAVGVVTVPTPKGTLVVECDDPDVAVTVTKDGAVLKEKSKDREFILAVGDYGIVLSEKTDGLVLETPAFKIVKGGKAVVRVRVGPPPEADDRKMIEALSKQGRTVDIEHKGQAIHLRPGDPIPDGPIELVATVRRSKKPITQADDRAMAELLPRRGDDRAVAELVHGRGVSLVLYDGQHIGIHRSDKPLPAGRLRLAGVDCGPKSSIDVTEAEALGRCAELIWVVLHGNTASLPGLAKLADSPAAARITNLGLDGSDYSDDDLALLTKFTGLQLLALTRCPELTDRVLGTVARLKTLRTFLAIDTRFTDAGVAGIAGLRLESLDLSACDKVGDASLRALAGMPTLRQLLVRDTAVTAAGVKAFAVARPACRVEWTGGVIEPTAK